MPDQSKSSRLTRDAPGIPGIAGNVPRRTASGAGPFKIIGGLVIVLVVLFVAGHWLFKAKYSEPPPAQHVAQIDIPAPAPDPTKSVPQATETNPAVATVAELSKPWSWKNFVFRDDLTGENIPAIIMHLPSASATRSAGYWAFHVKAPSGDCKLEVVTDVAKLRTDYDYKAARYPMVGDPCTRTVFDPLKMGQLPGNASNIWARGLIVQGSDLRPPLGIEVRVEGKEIQAIRSE
jgi:hypothetical protein